MCWRRLRKWLGADKPPSAVERKSPVNHELDTRSLADHFRLVERGRERGKNGEPHPKQRGLDSVETEVADYCNRLFQERRESFRRDAEVLKKRLEPSHDEDERGADADLENACNRMRDRLADEGSEIDELARRAQQSVKDLQTFREEHGISHEAEVPDSLNWSWGVLAGFIVFETIMNGFFFGEQMASGLLGGSLYAFFISALNVIAVGGAAALAFSQLRHKDQGRRLGGVLGLAAVVVVAVVWNVFVAHYRDALPPEFPEEVVTAEVPSEERERWGLDDEEAAEQQAVWLLVQNQLQLNGFNSYMLVLVGLLMCVVAAWKWYKMSDPYPGYGKLERARRRTRRELVDERGDLIEDIQEIHDHAVVAQRSAVPDPVKAWKRADDAYAKLVDSHAKFCDFARDLETSGSGAIEYYRSANREAPRTVPEPEAWKEPWKPEWQVPPLADGPSPDTLEDAKRKKEAVMTKLGERLEQLAEVHRECKADIHVRTRIRYE